MKKKAVFLLVLALAALLAIGCTNNKTESKTSSVTPSSSVEESSIPDYSSEETSVPESSETETSEISEPESTPEESVPETSEPETSVPETSIPSTSGDFASAEASIISKANDIRSAAGLNALSISDRLTTAAREAAQLMADGGESHIRASQYKYLPDGTSISSLVNKASSSEGRKSGLDFSMYNRFSPSSETDASALVNEIFASSGFNTKAAADKGSIGVGIYCAAGGPMVIIIFYAD